MVESRPTVAALIAQHDFLTAWQEMREMHHPQSRVAQHDAALLEGSHQAKKLEEPGRKRSGKKVVCDRRKFSDALAQRHPQLLELRQLLFHPGNEESRFLYGKVMTECKNHLCTGTASTRILILTLKPPVFICRAIRYAKHAA